MATAVLTFSARAEVRESVQVVTYTIRGDKMDAVRSDERLQRRAATGDDFDAITRTQFDWSFKLATSAEGCAIANIVIKFVAVTLLPRLETSDASLKHSFANYIEHVKVHEAGHVDNGRTIARRIDEALAAVPPMATCDGVREAANVHARAILAEGQAADVAYDKRTENGRLQGAHWP